MKAAFGRSIGSSFLDRSVEYGRVNSTPAETGRSWQQWALPSKARVPCCDLPTLSILSSQPFEPWSLFGGLSGPFLQRAAAKTTAQV
jgi:hypothetical protein